MINCFKIEIDCQENDPADIRIGGAEYLGYDFYVESTQVEEMKKYIIETCKNLKVPIINIYYDNTTLYSREPSKIWTKEKIKKSIQRNTAGLNLSETFDL